MTDQQERQEGSEIQGLCYRLVFLPKLELMSFDGDTLRWSEFWDSFEATVDKYHTLSSIDKLNYLNSKFTGDAKHAISGILLLNENCELRHY